MAEFDIQAKDLERAWNWRERAGLFDRSEAIRVFHGPGDGSRNIRGIAIDRFRNHYWLTEWESPGSDSRKKKIRELVVEFLSKKGATSIVGLTRPERGIPAESETLWGNPPVDRFVVEEGGLRFWIQMRRTRHPGLFLDHAPLRGWLRSRVKGLRVLNTFAYTGSLSVASGVGGASHVTTLDLSKTTAAWAQENLVLNNQNLQNHRLIAGDVFEWLPRLKREKSVFDCIILDPPSFSHGKVGKFSTSSDLPRLHELTLDLLSPGGFLITSINSAKVSWKKYESDLLSAGRSKKRDFSILNRIDLPDTFPTRLGEDEERYLKGWILKVTT